MPDLDKEIWLAYSTGRVLIGARKVIRLLKAGTEKPKLVVLAKNAPESIRKEIEYLAQMAGVPVIFHEGGSLSLGRAMRKPFFVSAAAIMEEGESSILEVVST
ncbi:MAG: 50S ribosomal protein L30e [Candidatus Korarchaeota archaeon]|nr:50S ribosomal protein L30e [Candidatus Korarchaeota archaeon]